MLVKALKAGDTSQVRELIESDSTLLERRGMWDNTPLLVACHCTPSNQACVTQRSVCLTARHPQPLFARPDHTTDLVLADAHAETALMLLDRGADAAAVNEQGCTALLFACVGRLESVTSRLLEQSATMVRCME